MARKAATMQPRKPKGAPNGTGGQYTTHPTTPNSLPHLDQYTGNGPQVDDRVCFSNLRSAL
jgi:hypothetical protein